MKKNLLVALLSAALTFILAEASIRLLVPQSDRFYEPNEKLGSLLKANFQGWWYGEYVFNREFATLVTTNNLGFHDVEHSQANPTKKQRLVLLGDSYLEALQVPLSQTVGRLLQRRLNHDSSEWEIISLGRAGASTAEEIVLWEEWGTRFKPNYVAILFSQNDLLENERLTPKTTGRPRFWLEENKLYRLPSIITPTNNVTGFIADHSHLARFFARFSLHQEKRSELARKAYEAALSNLELSLTPRLLETLFMKIETFGATPLVVFVDDDPQTNPLLTPIIKLLEVRQIDFIAMGDKQAPPNQQYYFPFDGHLNQKGHEHLATLIATALLD
ncbi:MAG: hypothetical protein HYS86_00415 [Candidatus Chisholmbacteria bacterium]|nr:hypothetical protein [Candidatus Chisholmbacteria bacterium]